MLQRFLTTFHRFNEAALLVEMSRYDFLYQLVRISALLSRGLCEFASSSGAKCTSMASE